MIFNIYSSIKLRYFKIKSSSVPNTADNMDANDQSVSDTDDIRGRVVSVIPSNRRRRLTQEVEMVNIDAIETLPQRANSYQIEDVSTTDLSTSSDSDEEGDESSMQYKGDVIDKKVSVDGLLLESIYGEVMQDTFEEDERSPLVANNVMNV